MVITPDVTVFMPTIDRAEGIHFMRLQGGVVFAQCNNHARIHYHCAAVPTVADFIAFARHQWTIIKDSN
jgi:hypothetical protein